MGPGQALLTAQGKTTLHHMEIATVFPWNDRHSHTRFQSFGSTVQQLAFLLHFTSIERMQKLWKEQNGTVLHTSENVRIRKLDTIFFVPFTKH
jgi:hypothetical protein